ncbi:MAG TPA: esterase-like activity of phytase family protein [Planctomycetota bacterium]|nr:esterase-like activity of phytase family protein [Planctomycetota bacterium]
MRGARKLGGATALAALLLTMSAGARAGDKGKDGGQEKCFNRIATFPVYLNTDESEATAAEIVAASEDGKTLIYTDSPGKRVGFVDICDPGCPKAYGTMDLDGEPTSVAVVDCYALVAVNTSENFVDTSGELVVIHIGKRDVVATIDLGGQPDCVAVSPDGCYAAVAIENERDEDVNDGEIPQYPAGYLAVIKLKGKPWKWEAKKVDLTGLADIAPQDPEPEYVSINECNVAVVTLQENNHIVLVDLACLKVVKHFPAGAVDLDDVDTVEDDKITLDGSLEDVNREPDAVKWIDKEHFLTANEGDYQGGSRGFTIFDKCGKVVYDSDNRYEHLAVRHGHYPESRSENKGTEPEGVEIADYGCGTYAFVGSERGNFVAVFKLGKKCSPEFGGFLPCTPAPEGLLAIPCRNLFVVSSEYDDVVEGEETGLRSTISIYRLEECGPDYPDVVSCDDDNGLPIPWGALSGLAADRCKSNIVYSVTDSYYSADPRILKIDASCHPAKIVKEIHVKDGNGDSPDYDLEGIVQREDGGFWLASEGNNSRKNLLVRVDKYGVVQEEVGLPSGLEANKTTNGFEGVALAYDCGDEVLYAAIQREWPKAGDPDGCIRIGEYRPDTGEWRFFYYPKSAPTSSNGGWVGLSEIVVVGKNKLAFIERDNQRGPDATLKWITECSIKGVTPVADGGTIPKLEKKVVCDVLPLLNSTHGWTQDKIEGLAVSCKGKAFLVTDNDGVDESTGETLFFDLGDYDDLCKGGCGKDKDNDSCDKDEKSGCDSKDDRDDDGEYGKKKDKTDNRD